MWLWQNLLQTCPFVSHSFGAKLHRWHFPTAMARAGHYVHTSTTIVDLKDISMAPFPKNLEFIQVPGCECLIVTSWVCIFDCYPLGVIIGINIMLKIIIRLT